MITIIWNHIVESMTWLFDSLRDFLFGSLSEEPRHTIDPHAGCEYCGMALARCGCGKYGISPIARALPGFITLHQSLSEIEIERLRKRMASAFADVPFGMVLE